MRGLVAGLWWLLALPACLQAGEPSTAQGACASWMASIDAYDRACDAVLKGEPEDAVSALTRLFEAQVGGDAAAFPELEARFRGKAEAFARIEAPAELAELHAKLVAYYRAVEAAADGILRRGEDIFSPAVRAAYQALHDYYRDMLGLLAEHQCDRGDIEALEKKMLPRLRAVLEKSDWHEAPRAHDAPPPAR